MKCRARLLWWLVLSASIVLGLSRISASLPAAAQTKQIQIFAKTPEGIRWHIQDGDVVLDSGTGAVTAGKTDSRGWVSFRSSSGDAPLVREVRLKGAVKFIMEDPGDRGRNPALSSSQVRTEFLCRVNIPVGRREWETTLDFIHVKAETTDVAGKAVKGHVILRATELDPGSAGGSGRASKTIVEAGTFDPLSPGIAEFLLPNAPGTTYNTTHLNVEALSAVYVVAGDAPALVSRLPTPPPAESFSDVKALGKLPIPGNQRVVLVIHPWFELRDQILTAIANTGVYDPARVPGMMDTLRNVQTVFDRAGNFATDALVIHAPVGADFNAATVAEDYVHEWSHTIADARRLPRERGGEHNQHEVLNTKDFALSEGRADLLGQMIMKLLGRSVSPTFSQDEVLGQLSGRAYRNHDEPMGRWISSCCTRALLEYYTAKAGGGPAHVLQLYLQEWDANRNVVGSIEEYFGAIGRNDPADLANTRDQILIAYRIMEPDLSRFALAVKETPHLGIPPADVYPGQVVPLQADATYGGAALVPSLRDFLQIEWRGTVQPLRTTKIGDGLAYTVPDRPPSQTVAITLVSPMSGLPPVYATAAHTFTLLGKLNLAVAVSPSQPAPGRKFGLKATVDEAARRSIEKSFATDVRFVWRDNGREIGKKQSIDKYSINEAAVPHTFEVEALLLLMKNGTPTQQSLAKASLTLTLDAPGTSSTKKAPAPTATGASGPTGVQAGGTGPAGGASGAGPAGSPSAAQAAGYWRYKETRRYVDDKPWPDGSSHPEVTVAGAEGAIKYHFEKQFVVGKPPEIHEGTVSWAFDSPMDKLVPGQPLVFSYDLTSSVRDPIACFDEDRLLVLWQDAASPLGLKEYAQTLCSSATWPPGQKGNIGPVPATLGTLDRSKGLVLAVWLRACRNIEYHRFYEWVGPAPPTGLAVSLTSSSTSPMPGQIVDVQANATGGKPGYTLVWSGSVSGSGGTVQFSQVQPGAYTLTADVIDADGNKASASITLTVSALKVTVRLVGISDGKVVVGVPVGVEAQVSPAKTPPGVVRKLLWQPHPEVVFDPQERTAAGRSTAVFQRPGRAGVWAVLLEEKAGAFQTVAESEPVEVEAVPPANQMRFDPSRPYVSQEVKARITPSPAVDTKYLDFRWMPLPANARQTKESQDNREITFYLRDDTPTEISAMARTPYHGDDMGEVRATVTARKHDVKVSGPTPRGPAPQEWKQGQGTVNATTGVKVDQTVSFSATFSPAASHPPVTYEWTASSDVCRIHNPIVQEPNVTCGTPGSYTLTVVVRDANAVELGRGSGSLTVEAALEPPNQNAEAAAAKLAQARAAVAAGKLDDGIALAGEAAGLDPRNPEAGKLRAQWQQEKAEVERLVNGMDQALGKQDLQQAATHLAAAQGYHPKYAPVVEAAARYDKAVADSKKRQAAATAENLGYVRGFAGDWDSNWGKLTLRVEGVSVIGDYTHDQGRIEAVLSSDGKTMTGTWGEAPSYKPPQDSGRVTFQLVGDGNRIDGTWGYGDTLTGGSWTGTRIVDQAPTVAAGDIKSWSKTYDPPAFNPKFFVEEVPSPIDGSALIRTRAVGNTVATCETKWIRRVIPTGPRNSSGASIEAYIAFTFNGTEYNLPSVNIELLDDQDRPLGSKVFYGKGVIGGFNRSRLAQTGYVELPAATGVQRIELNRIGPNIRFTKVAVNLQNYTCLGENSVTFGHFALRDGQAAPAEAPKPASTPGPPATTSSPSKPTPGKAPTARPQARGYTVYCVICKAETTFRGPRPPAACPHCGRKNARIIEHDKKGRKVVVGSGDWFHYKGQRLLLEPGESYE